MDYQTIYTALIGRSQNRVQPVCYIENHHIVPKCLGGTDDSTNLVALTAREHFVAHMLLAKIFGGTLWHAIHMMSNMQKYTNRTYAIARQHHSILVSEQNRKTKTKPKSIRYHVCKICGDVFGIVEFDHHIPKSPNSCSQQCNGKYNGIYGKHARGSEHHWHNRTTSWNKGLPNPIAAINARKGAAKMSAKVLGRRKVIRNDKSTWAYPGEPDYPKRG